MGWLSKFFPNSKSIDNVVTAAINTGDKLVFTAEEKAENDERIRSWYIDLLDSLKPYNWTMRALALGMFAMFSLHLLGSTIFASLAVLMCDPAAEVCRLADASSVLDNQLSNNINPHFSLIIQFFFGAAGINSIVSTIKGKK